MYVSWLIISEEELAKIGMNCGREIIVGILFLAKFGGILTYFRESVMCSGIYSLIKSVD